MRRPDVNTEDLMYQFRVILQGTQPMVWRRILVPGTYSFWDLHVAIQDAMGWLDCHLHLFRLRNPGTGEVDQIGIPIDDPFDDMEPCLPGWEVAMARYFRGPGDRADYEYDFGDGWRHEVVLEVISDRLPSAQYPICLDGARACPPEDCGGTHGYKELLVVLCDPTHEEYPSTLQWVGAGYDPAAFDPRNVRFDDPKKRWQQAFEGRSSSDLTH
jgi:hypothetical protein